MQKEFTQGLGALYVVATPIGNLADISYRAVETLKQVDLIAAEDTRHSSRLMQHFNITTPLLAYHDHTNIYRIEQIINKMADGQSVALVSDAGTPLISDPGYRLVNLAREQGIRVIPLPGACAAVAALSAAGLPSDRWTFEGFLPAKTMARQQRLKSLSKDERTLIFYESTHRLLDTLEDMQQVLGDERSLVLAREITKTYETFISGSIEEVLAYVTQDSNQQKGEFVLMLKGFQQAKQDDLSEAAIATMEILLEELPTKQAAAIGAKLTGYKKRDLYQWALAR